MSDDHDREAIEALHRADQRATRELDVDTLVSLWTEDGAGVGPGGRVVRGREAMAAQMRRSAEQSRGHEVLRYEQHFDDVEIAGEWAWELGSFESATRDPATGEESRVRGPMLRILRRAADGTWRFHRTMWVPAADG